MYSIKISTSQSHINSLYWIYIIKEIMVREFKFFRGYVDKTLTEQWEDIFREYPITTPGTGIINWGTTTTNPAWIVNPNPIHLYTPPNYTITTTPSYGTFTIPYSGQLIGTSTGFSLTTSNTNGTTYTTGGFGGTLTTGTSTYSSSSFKN